MKYFNHLTICRKNDDTWLEAKYLEKFAPSHGPVSTKTQEWLENNQYIFEFANPEVKFARVNLKLEQEDIRMTQEDISPPYTDKRVKIGVIVMEMAKAVDSVNHFEPKKLVKNIKPGAIRHLSTSF